MGENENPSIVSARSGTGNGSGSGNERVAETRQIWQTTLRDLQHQVNRADYDMWIKNLSLIELNEGQAWMSAPSTFHKKKLEDNYSGIIGDALTRVVGQRLQVSFIFDQPKQGQLFEEAALEQAVAKPRSTQTPAAQMKPNSYGQNGNFARTEPKTQATWNGTNYSPINYGNSPTVSNQPPGNGYFYGGGNYETEEVAEVQPDYTPRPAIAETNTSNYGYDHNRNDSGLNPRYLFEKYVEGSSNRVATAAARRVAEMPGYSYNPLFIYGGVGLGKTHLLHAIGHEAMHLRPGLTVRYVSSEKFTNDLVNSIREGRMEEFRARYRTIDILMIDDIQFIAGKNTTQEEFFHTFNSLVEANKQVVISSDRPPRAMLVLEERLRSRFEGGLTCDVLNPDYEMRLAILKAKADFQAISPIPPDVLEFIARKVESNIRELEGALTRVVAFALHNHTALSVEQAARALNDMMLNTRKKMVTPSRIVDQVSQYYSIDQKDLRGRSRSQDIVLPRQVAMYIIREHTETSLVEIGQELGGRDHTTVMHAIDKIEREIEVNTNLRSQINTIVQLLYSEGGK